MRVGPGAPPCPALSSLLIFSCSVCFFSFVSLVLFSFCLAVKICTFTLQIVNSKNCILNFYMREEEPTSIYIYINISLYIYIQIYIKQMVCHLVAFLWLKALFLSSFREADGIKAQELPFMPLDALCCGARIPGAGACSSIGRAGAGGVTTLLPWQPTRCVCVCLNPVLWLPCLNPGLGSGTEFSRMFQRRRWQRGPR